LYDIAILAPLKKGFDMGGLSPNLTPDGDAPNVYWTDGSGRPLNKDNTAKKGYVPGRYDPYNDRFDPEVFDTGMVVALTLASIALVAGIATLTVAIPTAIVRRLRRRKL
jgi:hypothetical protein